MSQAWFAVAFDGGMSDTDSMGPHDASRATPDYDTIRQEQNRSYSFALLDRLFSPEVSQEELGQIWWTLVALRDWRTFEPLFQLLEDPLRDESLRHLAGWMLRDMGAFSRKRARQYFFSEDLVLKRHGLLSLGLGDSDLVESIARQPEHPLYRYAILVMDNAFESNRFLELKIQALSHPDPEARRIAALGLQEQEPVLAEEALLRASLDPVPAVAIAAVDALDYYPTVRCVRGVSEIAHREDPVGTSARMTLDGLRSVICAELRKEGPFQARLHNWARPIADILADKESDLEPEEEPEPGELSKAISERVSADALLQMLEEPQGGWSEKLQRLHHADPEAIEGPDRKRLSECILTHPDAQVRGTGACLLAAWNDYERLLDLARNGSVFHSAIRALGQTRPNPEVAKFAKEFFRNPEWQGYPGHEVLGTFVVHASQDDSISLCETLAQKDHRANVRIVAVEQLVRMGARESIERLLSILKEPPAVTWELHIAELKACSQLGIAPRGLEELGRVDHLYVQEAVGWFD